MRHSGFDAEHELLEKAKGLLNSDSVSAADYLGLVQGYERLLSQAEKIVTVGDATQNKLMRAQRMLERAMQRYKALAEQKSELLALVSHDLKNKASPIRELSAWVLQDSGEHLSDRSREMMRHIVEAAEKLMVSANEILDREGGASSDIVPVMEWCDLAQLLRNTVESLAPTAEKKGIQMKVSIPSRCDAFIDEFLMGEVLENLVSNAIKFSPGGTSVEVRLSAPAGAIRLEVADEGQGLSETDKLGMFGRHGILSARPTGNEKSSGMGLFIVRKLVNLHGGNVWAESDGPGQGACFIVELPRNK